MTLGRFPRECAVLRSHIGLGAAVRAQGYANQRSRPCRLVSAVESTLASELRYVPKAVPTSAAGRAGQC